MGNGNHRKHRVNGHALMLRAVTVAVIVVLLTFGTDIVASQDRFVGKVVRVIDGDTIVVLRDGAGIKVRFYGIDTPESDQAWGAAATAFTRRAVLGRQVTVRTHGTGSRYHRTIGEVLQPDGRSLNRILVATGLAWWYQHYAPTNLELSRLEARARAEKRGLWADPAPVPPWEWRQRRQHSN